MTEGKLDPSDFGGALEAADDSTTDATASDSGGDGDGLAARFLDGSRSGRPAGELASEHGLPTWGGHLMRMFVRVSPTDDLPPVADGILGLGLLALTLSGGLEAGGDDGGSDEGGVDAEGVDIEFTDAS